jgi:hypothetical protein
MITIFEALVISAITIITWALVKTIKQTIDEKKEIR